MITKGRGQTGICRGETSQTPHPATGVYRNFIAHPSQRERDIFFFDLNAPVALGSR
jgi:hypothetical protein